MRNIRLSLEYDGSDYSGWQLQPDALTVQQAVEAALEKMLKTPTRIIAAGRTDAGVHALDQAANFRTGASIPLRGFFYGLNTLTPPDVSVKRVDEMPESFDSRRSAKEKIYRYFLYTGAAPSAVARRTSWRPQLLPLDVDAMHRAAECLVGVHDFGAFRSAGCEAAHAVRHIYEALVEKKGDFIEISLRGNAFLRHMVRIIVGTLVEIGQGKRSVESIGRMIENKDRGQAGVTAPPQGLFLWKVNYEDQPLETYP